MLIRGLAPEELPAALSLAWETFLAYEAPDYSPEGVETFRALLADPAFAGGLEFWGAFGGDGEMLGLIATRSQRSHLTLFFVEQHYLGMGIGRKLFSHLLSLCPGPVLTVNSSPYAVPVYEKLGFLPQGPEELKDGIRSTPMYYKL